MIRIVSTLSAPTPAGHYSQATVHDGVVYVAGQLPIDPGAPDKEPGTIEQQAEQTLRNLRAILEAAGSRLDHVLKVTVFISDIEQWGRVNGVYAGFFGAHRPARSVVPTKELRRGYLIEIDAIAAVAN